MILLGAEPQSTVWLANWITTTILGIMIAALAWFLKRYIAQQDARHKELDAKVDGCDERSDNIEKNYKKEFVTIRTEINASNQRLGEKLTQEIREITKDKNMADILQVKEQTEIKGEVRNLRERVEQVLRVIK